MKRVIAPILVMAAAAACATSTKVTDAWKDPATQGLKFDKIVVAFQTSDESLRRTAEDEMAIRIARSTPSYTILNEAQSRDAAQAKAVVTAAGFDGAVVARFVRETTESHYVPGTVWTGPTAYGSMWGYWGYGWGAVYEPGYMVQDTVITLETNVYSVAGDKLVWASRSETFNPASSRDLLKSVIAATAARMRREGLF